MRPIADVAKELGLAAGAFTPYGDWKAKVNLPLEGGPDTAHGLGVLVMVTAMTPTPSGEGKTVTTIGLGMGLRRLGKKSIVCLRQPSLGPIFGAKGGAAGGGRCTVEPMQDINLHFTGDINAVGSAHNLLSAMLDNHIFHGNELGLDSETLTWPRAVDMNDRALRRIVVGMGEARRGVQHESSYVITAASEIMAIHGLSKDLAELRSRLGRVTVGYGGDRRPVTAEQLKAAGAMAVVLKESLAPNLVQTAEGTPALVHGGPFANIAHGTSSLTSILLGLKVADYCVVELGFASDLGAEKFIDIVTRVGGFEVSVAVIVVTVRALRFHGGVPKDALESPNLKAVAAGLDNLAKHVENMGKFGLTPVVAINRFPSDSEDEIRQVREFCRERGLPCAVSTAFTDGSEGAVELSRSVVDAAELREKSRPIYSLGMSIEEKLDLLTREVYGGTGVDYEQEALEDIALISRLGLAGQPVCVAKTPLSLSDDPKKIGRPRGFKCRVHHVRPAAGAGFNVAYMGEVTTMPGLPKVPLAEQMDLTDDGLTAGLR